MALNFAKFTVSAALLVQADYQSSVFLASISRLYVLASFQSEAPQCITSVVIGLLIQAPAIGSGIPLKFDSICVPAGHVLLPGLLGAGSEDEAASLLDDMLRLYSDHERDAGDTLMMAYEAGSWTKVRRSGQVILHFHCAAFCRPAAAIRALTVRD